MPAIVVVALPEKDELVNEVSSEEKAHMTLLYLDAPMGINEQHIIEFVQHAATVALKKFGLPVDKRGTLGPKDADVLFFETEYAKDLRSFRAELLKDDTIATHYVKTDQFPGWIPHLTLGYPEAPAKEVDRDERYGLRYVSFDRIAVWTSDFDGPEFELGDNKDLYVDAAWSIPDTPADISHAESTVGSVYEAMDEDKRTLIHVGVSAPEDEEFTDEELDDLADVYSSMTEEEVAVMNFIVGQTASPAFEEPVEHSGVKGMHWGVRKDDSGGSSRNAKLAAIAKRVHDGGAPDSLSARIRNSKDPKAEVAKAKQAVKSGRATLEQAHIAGLKTKGHRTVNAFLGDKTFWKRAAIIAGAVGVGLTAAAIAPHFIPTATLIAIGGGKAVTIGSTGYTAGLHSAAFAKIGAVVVTKAASVAVSLAGTGATQVESYKNFGRAVRGTARINKSYEKMGRDIALRQEAASRRMLRILTRNGSLARKDILQQDAFTDEEFLAHFGRLGMKWGVRRPTGPGGLVTGSVADALKKSGASDGAGIVDNGRTRKSKVSVDHKQIQKNLKKDVATLSTEEIKQITARIKAVREFKAITAAQKEAQRSHAEKIARWALGAVVAGAKQHGENYIKEITGDTLSDILPKSKSQKTRDKDARKKQEKENAKTAADAAAKRDRAVRDLRDQIMDQNDVFDITSLPVRRG